MVTVWRRSALVAGVMAAGVMAAGLAMGGVTAAPASAAPGDTFTVFLTEAIAGLPVVDEDRTGYERTAFRHWIDEDRDGCSTRAEVLLAEATTAPQVGARCAVTGGVWHSYYDNSDVADASALDIDHMVPLAEAWDSGASQWTAARRQAYANDLGDSRALVAVTARENRQKADQDPATWLPQDENAHCRYLTEWVAVKTRWGLSVDTLEHAALGEISDRCEDTQITITEA